MKNQAYFLYLHVVPPFAGWLAGRGRQGNIGSHELRTAEPPSAWIPERLQEVELLHFQPTRRKS